MRYTWLCGLLLGVLPMTASAGEGCRVHYLGGCGYRHSSYYTPGYRGYWYPTVYVAPSYYCPPVVVYTTPSVVYVPAVTYVPQTIVAPAPQYYPAPIPAAAPSPEPYYYGQ